MKLLSWNVNGVRSILRKGFVDFIEREQPDVLCLQETRAHPEQVQLQLPGYELHWNWSTSRKGYSGVSIFTRLPTVGVQRGLGVKRHDSEGRVLTVELQDMYVVSVYVPNSKRDLSRLEERLRWDAAFRKYVRGLAKHKPVVFSGDMNVAHTELDLARPKQNQKNHGFTPEERASFGKLLASGFIDTFREMHPGEGGHYTWWRQFGGARERNVGWRIDYVCASESLRERIDSAFILSHVFGSDHCPVGIRIKPLVQ